MSNVGGHYLVLLEMEIKIYLSESNSLIYFHLVLDKNWKIYWSKQSFTGLCPQDWYSLWGLILILFVDHLCSNFIFIIWYFCNNMNLLNMGNNPVKNINVSIKWYFHQMSVYTCMTIHKYLPMVVVFKISYWSVTTGIGLHVLNSV
jgi:hypothetical protein